MRFLTPILCLFVLFCTPALANVNDIEVIAQVEGNSPLHAQQKAIEYAKKRAFFLALSRYAPHDKAKKIAESLTDEQIDTHIRGYELLEDRLDQDRPNYYLVKYKVSVSDAMIRRLAAQDQLPQDDSDANPILILPVMRDGETIMLWEAQNVWRSIWNSVALEAGEGLLVMPYGDPDDTVYVNSATVLGYGFPELEPITQRYGAGEVVVAVATIAEDRTPPGLEVMLHRMGPGVNKTKSLYYETSGEAQAPESLMPDAAREIAEQLKEISRTYQGEVLKRIANAKRIKLRAHFRRLNEWVSIKEKLNALPRVVKLEIDRIDIASADATLLYETTPEMMLEIMQASGLYVQQQGDVWSVQVP